MVSITCWCMYSILFVHFMKFEDLRLILRKRQQISPCSLCLLSGSTLDLKGGLKPKTPGHRGLESEMTFASESSVPYPSRADEYGVPLLDISSESDDVSSADVRRQTLPAFVHVCFVNAPAYFLYCPIRRFRPFGWTKNNKNACV